jgi:glucosyl-dolichyl phosphate glucuronosyltransferase
LTEEGTNARRTLVLIDPARRFGSVTDQKFSDRLARTFHTQGWTVKWAIDVDDDLPPRAYASVHRILQPSKIRAGVIAAPAQDDALATVVPTSPTPTLRGSHTTSTSHEDTLTGLLRSCSSTDLIVFPAAETVHLEMLLEWLSALQIETPLPTTLHMRFTGTPRLLVRRGELDTETIADRLASGSPVRSLVFHADSAEAAARYAREIGLPVREIDTGGGQCTPDIPNVALPSLFLNHQHPNAGNHNSTPSLVVEQLGPMVLLISALWGRVGSSQVFDAQTRYLIAQGYIVIRIFIDHWPHFGHMRMDRIGTFIRENFDHIRPHVYFIAERDEAPGYVQQLLTEPKFRTASPVRRIQLLLAKPTTEQAHALAWCAKRATLAIVNHLPHVAFADHLTQAPIVLETHDIYSHLLDSHGIPGFIPGGPDGRHLRMTEEQETWAQVAACVNLSPEDHEHVAKAAKFSVLIRPYVTNPERSRRSWLEVLAENRLDPAFRTCSVFDMMLWGSPHEANARSITWFLDEVVTAHEELRHARILIIGRVIDAFDQFLLRRTNLFVAGFVDRLEDFAFRTKVLIIPDQNGTGISIKAMDAFALSACFAATKIGARGIDLGDTGYVPATDAKTLGADIVRLLGSASARRERANLARRLYDLNFSSDAYTQAWDSVIASVAGDTQRRTTYTTASIGRDTLPAPVSTAVCEKAVQLACTKADGELADAAVPEKPRLTAIVCTYDRYEVLPDVLASLLTQDCIPGFLEIIVVDNSPDQVAAAAFGEQYREENHIRYLLEPTPGLSNARNVGTRAARAELVAFIDDDAIAAPNWAQEIVRAFDVYGSRAGAVGGRIAPRWVTPPPTWLSDGLLGYLSIVDWGGKMRELTSAEWLAGCNIAFDKEVLTLAGGFSPALGRIGSALSLLSNEDIEMIERINAGGRVSIYAPAATVDHVIDPSRLTHEWFRRRAAWQAVSDFIKDPKRAALHAPAASKHLESFALRKPLGFYVATEDPEEFKQDMCLTYDLVIATLSGGVNLDSAKMRDPLSFCDAALAFTKHLGLRILDRPSKDTFIKLIGEILRIVGRSSDKDHLYDVLDRVREFAAHAITDREGYDQLMQSLPTSILLEYYDSRL